MTILITGGTGFLGRSLLRECLNNDMDVIVLSHSEIRDKEMQLEHPEVKSYCVDISTDAEILDRIVEQNNVEYIVHCAAMKHIGICENNPTKAIEVNINGSRNIISVAKKNKVKNVVAVSTDKAINPSCVYGSTKLLMEKVMLENSFSVIQGVNFFFSSGSVLEIWHSCIKNKEPIRVNINDTVRYFVSASDVAKKILENLDTKSSYISLDSCHRVKLHNLSEAFCEYHNFYKIEDYVPISAEKIVEEVPDGIRNIHEPDMAELEDMIHRHYKEQRCP